MFGSYYYVYIILALYTVIKTGKQAIGIRRQVHSDNVSFFVSHMIKEARILMGKSVVVLLPYIRR